MLSRSCSWCGASPWPRLWPHLLGFVRLIREKLAAGIRELGGASWMADVLLAGALGFLLLANAATIRTVALLADVTVPPEQPRTNWPAAREALEPWLERADIVVTTEELGHLYFLGRYDVRFSPSKLGELGDDGTTRIRLGSPHGAASDRHQGIAGADPRLLSERDHRRAGGALGTARPDQ